MAKNDVQYTDELPEISDAVKSAISSIAKGLGVAATELWVIFVRQYIVRGLSELFTAIVLYAASWLLYGKIGLFSLIPAGLGIAFTYGAIAYLGNPKYYALTDVTKRVKEFTSRY